ncbi:uncharacterized protein PGTG_03380 [Puccinia graminis f. sp. tritici CRL 75-36-700-3]|uniref:Uncharacterized protein n=1 Tax=Puccinia graminis f. sp. tritici (strain CRL 75-36-700-3 / race SCCL) TaxID=418459 RepID=E3JZE9_PUCGT|nr:uncharacterized protein PGTG_03380 [Puccinia graminis f. sp. tritici CRL 75-36-700-3]EFP77424.1 hypothetical protein PGTG_03380 [Puccinia graminis f. sp. tritici CRL 75-36-700-3]
MIWWKNDWRTSYGYGIAITGFDRDPSRSKEYQSRRRIDFTESSERVLIEDTNQGRRVWEGLLGYGWGGVLGFASDSTLPLLLSKVDVSEDLNDLKSFKAPD